MQSQTTSKLAGMFFVDAITQLIGINSVMTLLYRFNIGLLTLTFHFP